MTSLYDLTFPPLIASLKTEQNLLAKAEEYAAEKGIDVQELLDTRLAPDMWPLSQQFTITALHAVMTVVKLAGVTPNSVQFGPGMCFYLFPSSFCFLCFVLLPLGMS